MLKKLFTSKYIYLQISSVQIHNKAMVANVAIAGAMGTTAKTMGNINKILNPQQIAKDMESFKYASAKMDMTDDLSKFLLLYVKLILL